MNGRLIKRLAGGVFRANPAYELVPFDRLPENQKSALNYLRQDSECYGILQPHTGCLGIKSVSHDAALLFSALQRPGKLPAYIGAMLGERLNDVIASLVLDEVLQIKSGEDFLSGVNAHGLVYKHHEQCARSRTVLADLSLQALKYATMLNLEESAVLSTRLYLYNTVPASPHWRRLFPSEAALTEHMELMPGGRNRLLLDKYGLSSYPARTRTAWNMWGLPCNHEGRVVSKSYKLYLSPSCEHLREVFRAALDVFAAQSASCFKIGKDLHGVLRPDKLIGYFTNLEKMTQAADCVLVRLDGVPAQGVPFTSAIDKAGLVSWGVDPPPSEMPVVWRGSSWRRWITDRLAVALVSAKTATSRTVEPWKFALDRARLEGIETSSWTPLESLLEAARYHEL